MKIELFNLTQTVLIVPEKTGVIYTNQVGGTECAHPEMEGYIVPVEYDYLLKNASNSLTYKLCQFFPEGSPGYIDHAMAENIQELLNASPLTSDIEVNANNLRNSKEAWLHVNVNGTIAGTVKSESVKNAVLTWPNSD